MIISKCPPVGINKSKLESNREVKNLEGSS